MNVWKCKLIFTTDTLQIEITDLTPFLAAENTSVLIILTTPVFIKYINCDTAPYTFETERQIDRQTDRQIKLKETRCTACRRESLTTLNQLSQNKIYINFIFIFDRLFCPSTPE